MCVCASGSVCASTLSKTCLYVTCGCRHGSRQHRCYYWNFVCPSRLISNSISFLPCTVPPQCDWAHLLFVFLSPLSPSFPSSLSLPSSLLPLFLTLLFSSGSLYLSSVSSALHLQLLKHPIVTLRTSPGPLSHITPGGWCPWRCVCSSLDRPILSPQCPRII